MLTCAWLGGVTHRAWDLACRILLRNTYAQSREVLTLLACLCEHAGTTYADVC